MERNSNRNTKDRSLTILEIIVSNIIIVFSKVLWVLKVYVSDSACNLKNTIKEKSGIKATAVFDVKFKTNFPPCLFDIASQK